MEVERKIAEDNKNATYIVPIDGGDGNWKLKEIDIAPISVKYKQDRISTFVFPIVNSEYSRVELFTTIAPIMIESEMANQSIIHYQE